MTGRETILAKSPAIQGRVSFHETLEGHAGSVAESFQLLFQAESQSGRLGRKWLAFFKLSDTDWNSFTAHGVASAWLHDLGKANNSFQQLVRRESTAQAIRHEQLSGLLLNLSDVAAYFSQYLDLDLLLSVIMSHHLRLDRKTIGQAGLFEGFHLHVAAIQTLFQRAAASIDPELHCPDFNVPHQWSFLDNPNSYSVYEAVDNLRHRLEKYHRSLKKKPEENRLLRALRAALIVSDSAGSAILREDKQLSSWLAPLFSNDYILTDKQIKEEVIEARTSTISKSRPFRWSQFQDSAAELPDRSLLITPCGSGKTLAAWRWIASQAARRSITRAIFLYPTRGTAAEGFRDYVSWAPESDAALISGSSSFDLEGMFDHPSDERSNRSYLTEDRLFALGYWPRRIFSSTVDQFLGFIQNVYASICLLPLLCDSVLVIDEVHSFDKGLFAALKGFLKEFDLPVLCMTASLPESRIETLRQLGLRLFPDPKSNSAEVFPDLAERSHKPRYQVEQLAKSEEAFEKARDYLSKGQRVLWVVNTTERCQTLARELNALCYHSRFRLTDRKKQHDQVVRAFQQKETPVCAVTTQVCEMSLDLDADVLISEYAPITALIQRMGRCNRRDFPDQNRKGHVFIYKAENIRPYDEESMKGVPEFVRALDGKTVTQAQLESLLEAHGPDHYEAERWLAFITGGVNALSREESLRESRDYTVQALLDNDLEKYLQLRAARSPAAQGMLLPVPRRDGYKDNRLPSWLWGASSENYDLNLGYMPKPRKESS